MTRRRSDDGAFWRNIGSGGNTSGEQIHSNRSRSGSVRGAPYISPRRNEWNTLHFATKERLGVLLEWRRGRSRSEPVLRSARNPGVCGIRSISRTRAASFWLLLHGANLRAVMKRAGSVVVGKKKEADASCLSFLVTRATFAEACAPDR